MGSSKEVFLQLQPEQAIPPVSTRTNTCITAHPQSRKELIVCVIKASDQIPAFFSEKTQHSKAHYCGSLW